MEENQEWTINIGIYSFFFFFVQILRDRSIALKDLDFLEDETKIRVHASQKEFILNQIKNDSEFLKTNNIIDYSLLIGLHEIKVEVG